MIAAAALALSLSLPELPPLPQVQRAAQVTYVDRSGGVIGVRGGRATQPVDLSTIPAYVPAAFVAIEDRRFYEHGGFDPVGIARAIVTDLGRGREAQGASTITQQLARNLYLSSDRTMERKAQELMYAIQLERRYSKRQILEMYLSRVYFGSGATGLEAASRRFFDKPASRLTLGEAATLAGVLKSPTNYNPIDHPERSAERATLVLDAMVETGAITPAQRARALARPVRVHRVAESGAAQYFVDWLDGQTRRLLGPPKQDLVVETTLDLPLEDRAAADTAAVLTRHARQGIEQAALVAVDGQGRVRAMIGGAAYGVSGYNRAVSAHRQAGSAWKPFVYLTALEQGRTPDDPVVDEPVTIGRWSPKNFEPGYEGPISLERALAQSINTVAARLADEVGRDKVAATAHRLGIVSTINTDPAMALGTTLVAPIEMAQAYASFSNGGARVSAYGIERIRTAQGQVLYRHSGGPTPTIGNPPLSELDRMLRSVIATGTGVHAAIPGYDVAGKTGTTTDYRDAWFCGFSGGFTTVVWLGRDDNSPMRGITGGSAPAELWRSFMVAALPRVGARAIPVGPPASVVVSPGALPPPSETPPASATGDPIDSLLPGQAPGPPPPPPPEGYGEPPPTR